MTGPKPLQLPCILNHQYSVEVVLGQGGFGITYRALDTSNGKRVVIKELAPIGAVRLENGSLSFETLGQAAVHRLRIQFAREVDVLSKVRPMGAVTCYSTFVANQTAYAVMPYHEGARTLDDILKLGLLESAGVEEIVVQILHGLDQIHASGVLHLDIKPSNILILANESVRLIDFGSAREWIASQSGQHTIQFSPGFAPLEQLSDQTRRGPGTDLYALAASAWRSMTDVPLVDAVARLQGIELPDLAELVPGISENFAAAIGAALSIRLDDRPQSAKEMLEIIDGELSEDANIDDYHELDKRLVTLRKLKLRGKECPGCNGVLGVARPGKERQCWVCHKGAVTGRKLNEKTCAACKVGVLKPYDNTEPLCFCPKCRTGRLAGMGIKMPWSKNALNCQSCGAQFEEVKGGVSIVGTDELTNWSELRAFSGRSAEVLACDVCDAQFDIQADGRWVIVKPNKGVNGYTELYPDEWARLAKGMDPGGGNAECNKCGADFHLDINSIALLELPANIEPQPNHHLGKLMNFEQAMWVAGGKASGEFGLVCDRCELEFDFEETETDLRLIFSGTSNSVRSDRLLRLNGYTFTHANWHRVALGLPFVGEESLLDGALDEAIVDGFVRGEFSGKYHWQCSATDENGRSTTLRGDNSGLIFGGRFRKTNLEWSSIVDVRVLAGETIEILLSDARALVFQVEPTYIDVILESGNRRISLFANDIVRRCKFQLTT